MKIRSQNYLLYRVSILKYRDSHNLRLDFEAFRRAFSSFLIVFTVPTTT